MATARYPIPAATTRTELRVANSRFVATIGEARSASEAKAFVAAMRAEMPDATHHVSAFRAGYGATIVEGMSDDGEPPGSAGRPALAVLRGADLGDVALVISRYFGGTKLGVGGLVRAYTQAAQEALAALPRAERVEIRRGELTVPYSLYERVQALARELGEIASEQFGAEVNLKVALPVDRVAEFEGRLTELSAAKVAMRWDTPA